MRGNRVFATLLAVALVSSSLWLAHGQPREAAAQGAAAADVSVDRIWTEYVPGLAGKNTVRRERNRARLVQLGDEAVEHLVSALSTPSLLERLHEANQLPGLRDELTDDMNAWLDRNAEQLENFVRMRRLVNGYNRFNDNDRLLHGVRLIYEALDEFEEEVPRPELLNSVRAFAALALGEIGATQHDGEIAALLQDGSRDVRARAIQALGRLGADQYAEEIEPFLFVRNDVFVRSCAWTALRRMDSRESVTRLIEELAAIDPREEALRHRHIVQGLEGITMRNFGGNAGLWQQWWQGAQNEDDPFGLRFAQEAGAQ